MSGDAASAPGAERRPRSLGRELGRWLLAPDFYRERVITADNWVEAAFEPAALAVLVGLFVGGVVTFGLAIVPTWDARFLLPLCLIAALEAFFYSRRLARPSFMLKEWVILLAPPVLALRFLPYLAGPDDLLLDVAEWWRSPASFFTATFVVNLTLLLLAWIVALESTQNLNRLRLQPGEVPADADAARRYQLYDDGWRFVDHATPLSRLANMVLWGGVLLVFLAGLAAIDVRQVFTPTALLQLITFSRPAVSLAFSNVILYFVVGLLLLAEAQYVRQRTAWQLDHLTPPANLAPRWVVQAAVVTVAIACLAMLLPTDYAMTVSELLGMVAQVAVLIMQAVVGVLLFVMMLLMTPLRWLFAGGGGDSLGPMQPPMRPEVAPPAAPVPWLEVLRSLVFWLVALAIVVYCLSVVWRRRPPLPAWANLGLLGKLLAGLGQALAMLRRWGRSAALAVAAALPRLHHGAAQPVRRTFRWLALSRLAPRQLVEYFYLSVLERAARMGYVREKGETASEFSRRLPDRLPDVEPELSALTDTFLEVRYSPRPVEEGLVKAARAHWQRLKLKLRGRRMERARGRDLT